MVAFAVFVAANALQIWAMAVNIFFSTALRLQTERGHELVRGGPIATFDTLVISRCFSLCFRRPSHLLEGRTSPSNNVRGAHFIAGRARRPISPQ